MIKITAALLVVAAAAVAPPRIELNLAPSAVIDHSTLASTRLYQNMLQSHVQSGNAVDSAFTTLSGEADLTTPTYDATGTKGAPATVQQRQDWSQQCAADAMTLTNCPVPTCNAYDHNDKQLTCHVHRYLVDYENTNKWNNNTLPKKIADVADTTGTNKIPAAYSDAFAGKRATWLFKYDAKDEAGNRAEQVVFALIVNDISAPVISSCYTDPGASELGTSVVIEAASARTKGTDASTTNHVFCRKDARTVNAPAIGSSARVTTNTFGTTPKAKGNNFFATDNVDSDALVSSWKHMKFDVLEGENQLVTAGNIHAVRAALDSKLLSPLGAKRQATVTARTHDDAGYYGKDGFDNTATFDVDVTIVDTIGPKMHYEGTSVAYGECCRSGLKENQCRKNTWAGYTEVLHKATDANDGDISHNVIVGTGNVPNTTLYSDGIALTDGSYTVGLTQKTSASSPKKVYQYVFDAAGNQGEYSGLPYAVRVVHVVDRTAPTVTLKGSSSVLLKSNAANVAYDQYYVDSQDPGFKKWDTCNLNKDLYCTTTWQNSEAPDFTKLKDYVREYKCCDSASACTLATDGTAYWVPSNVDGTPTNCCADAQGKAIECCATKTRTFSMVDDQAPTITLIPGENDPATGVTVVELSNLHEYTDPGAQCHDYVDGVLSHAVEVSGDVVDMRTVGDYKVRYDCTDLSGHAAQYRERIVKVRDTRAPNATLVGEAQLYQEAGFKYNDLGITAVDADQDGDIDTSVRWVDPVKKCTATDTTPCVSATATGTAGCLTWGNTVNEAHFTGSDSSSNTQWGDSVNDCRSVYKVSGGKAPSGKYYLKVNGNTVEVFCDMTSGSIKTLIAVEDATTVAVPFDADSGTLNDCTQYGGTWNLATFPNAINKQNAKDALGSYYSEGEWRNIYFPTTPNVAQAQYLCSPNNEAASTHASDTLVADAAYAPMAAVDTFRITYFCKDTAGNMDAAWASGNPVSRDVNIVDTLAPVITLHMGKNLLASSVPSTRTRGVDNRINPAEQDKTENSVHGNPNLQNLLMATTSTTSLNGWIIGALASAVSGLALLGYSFRKTHVVTSVPV